MPRGSPEPARSAPRIVLGVVDGLHDAGAAIVRDGRLVAAANEERFTRVSFQGGMPHASIRAVVSTAKIDASDVDVVAIGGLATPTLGTRIFRPAQRWFAPSLGICFDRPWHPVDRLGDLLRYRLGASRSRPDQGVGRVEGALAGPVVRMGLPHGLRGKPLRFVDHHLAHAESAYRTAGPGRWLVVTADAHGDGHSLTVSVGEDGRLAPVLDIGVQTSVGAFYSLVTRRLGFIPGRDEGKVLGLAASGSADRVAMRYPFAWDGDRLAYDGEWGLRARRMFRAIDGVSREDVAAWVQRGTERVFLEGATRWLAATGTDRIALAGGVFANVLLNALLAALPGVETIHVFPHMGDGGLAAGAALHVADAPPARLSGVFLGPEHAEDDYERAAGGSGCGVSRPDDPDAVLLEHLAAGRAVARYVGAMEFGPRALGHRSILCPADRPEATADLNRALARDDFMPFAPILREEESTAAFPTLGPCASAARYMTVALPVADAFRRAVPAAVHVDGTARPQVVSRGGDPEMHALLTSYVDRTGLPAVVNTSFNLHQEPIVESPRDAVRSFVASGLAALRLGPFVLESPKSKTNGRAAARVTVHGGNGGA